MARRSSRKLAKARHEFLLAQERAREAKKAAKAERKRERISAAAEAVRKSSLAAAVHAAVHEHIAAAAKSASAASGSASSTSASKGKRKRSNSNAFESPLLSSLASQYPNANVVTLPEVRDEPANIDDGDMADDAADPRGEVIQKRRRIKVPKSVRKKIKRQEKFGLASSMKE